MTLSTSTPSLTIGVLALQGAFSEHIQLLRTAATSSFLATSDSSLQPKFKFLEVRTPTDLAACDALIIPGGESTTISLVAASSGLLEPLRDFVKVKRKPTWGTCAGLILLAESANRTKRGGQELIGGLDVRVDRNHFGRQVESFVTNVSLPFLSSISPNASSNSSSSDLLSTTNTPAFRAVFIRAPIVERILKRMPGIQTSEATIENTVVAPSRAAEASVSKELLETEVDILARLPATQGKEGEEGSIVAVRQGNCFGTSFHPELTDDERIHVWWLKEVLESLKHK